MSELSVALGSTDDDPLPIQLGGHQVGEHRADVIPLPSVFPVQAERKVRTNRLQAMSARLIARASRPDGVNAQHILQHQIRAARRLDSLRFSGQSSDTLVR